MNGEQPPGRCHDRRSIRGPGTSTAEPSARFRPGAKRSPIARARVLRSDRTYVPFSMPIPFRPHPHRNPHQSEPIHRRTLTDEAAREPSERDRFTAETVRRTTVMVYYRGKIRRIRRNRRGLREQAWSPRGSRIDRWGGDRSPRDLPGSRRQRSASRSASSASNSASVSSGTPAASASSRFRWPGSSPTTR